MHPLIPTVPPDPDWIVQWAQAAARPDVMECMLALHQHIDDAAALHRPICIASGHCCRFGAHGHLLAVTGLEALWSLQRLCGPVEMTAAAGAVAAQTCAFLVNGRCSIHWARPTGCRSYYCDGATAPWQHALAESVHGEIRALHERTGVPYLLAEWTWLVAAIESARGRGFLGSDRGAYHSPHARV